MHCILVAHTFHLCLWETASLGLQVIVTLSGLGPWWWQINEVLSVPAEKENYVKHLGCRQCTDTVAQQPYPITRVTYNVHDAVKRHLVARRARSCG